MGIGSAVIRPLKDALDGMPVHMKQLAEMFRKHAQKQNKNNDSVADVDKFDTPLTGISTNRVDRTTNELLYRSDDRPPKVIFEEGFQVLDASNNDLNTFVNDNNASNFVSTTRDENLYQRWGSDFRYTIDAPGGIDVDATMPDGPYAPHTAAPEFEIAFQGGIPAENIVGAHPVLPDGGLGDWIPNPNYSGGK